VEHGGSVLALHVIAASPCVWVEAQYVVEHHAELLAEQAVEDKVDGRVYGHQERAAHVQQVVLNTEKSNALILQ
jgi:hypothetical protein